MGRRKQLEPTYRLKLWKGRWWISYTDPVKGGTRRISTGAKEHDAARLFLKQYLAGLAHPEPPKSPAMSAILDGYQADKGQNWSVAMPSFVRGLKRRLGHLRPEHVGQRYYWTERAKDGVKLSTIRAEVLILRASLSWAVKAGWPVAAPFIEAPPQQAARRRWLTRDEADKLLEACQYLYVKAFVMLCLHTGARHRAVLELKWAMVDFGSGLIDYDIPGRNVTRKRRPLVPMNEPLRAILLQAREAARSDFVIEYKGRPLASNVQGAFRSAVKRAGIAHCTPHSLKHTCCTWMIMAGIPVKQVADYVGDTAAMIEKVYGHFAPDYLKDAAQALAGGKKRLRAVEEA